MTENKVRCLHRKLIVNPTVQYVLLLYSLSVGLLFMALGVTVTLAIQRYYLLQTEGWNLFRVSDLYLLSFIVAIIMATVYLGFVFSNQVAGPIFRMERDMHRVSSGGKPAPLVLRKNDHFQELASAYNRILERLPQSGSTTEEN